MVQDPVCKMEIEEEAAAAQELFQGTTWFFCSESCHGKFQENPVQYIQANTLLDPVCGMEVSADSEHHIEHQGKTYYFCSDSCLGKFNQQPTQYA